MTTPLIYLPVKAAVENLNRKHCSAFHSMMMAYSDGNVLLFMCMKTMQKQSVVVTKHLLITSAVVNIYEYFTALYNGLLGSKSN